MGHKAIPEDDGNLQLPLIFEPIAQSDSAQIMPASAVPPLATSPITTPPIITQSATPTITSTISASAAALAPVIPLTDFPLTDLLPQPGPKVPRLSARKAAQERIHKPNIPIPGAEYAITWIMPDRTLDGMLSSRANVIGWRIDRESRSLVEPCEFTYVMPLRYPFDASKYRIVSNKLQIFKDETRGKLEKIARRIEDRGGDTQQLLTKINNYLRHINYNIRIEQLPKNKFGESICNLVVPPVNAADISKFFSDVLNLVNHNRPQIQYEESFNFPFGVFTHENGVAKPDTKRRVVPLDYVRNSVIVSQDSEADRWERLFAPSQLFALTQEQLREVYVAFSALDPKRPDPRKLLGATRREMVRDIERIANAIKGETLDLQQLYSKKFGGAMIGQYNFFTSSIPVNIPGSDKKVNFELIHARDAEEMIRLTEDKIQEWQPLIIIGQNNFKYDFNKPIQLHGHFLIGVNYKSVTQRGQIPDGFFVRMAVPGRECIDIMGLMQHYAQTQSKRMDINHQYVTGIHDPKVYAHKDLPQAVAQAKQDPLAQARYLGYGGKDTLKPDQVVDMALGLHYYAARATGSSFGRIDMVAKRTRAIEFWNRQYSGERGKFPPSLENLTLSPFHGSRRLQDFSPHDFVHAGLRTALRVLNEEMQERTTTVRQQQLSIGAAHVESESAGYEYKSYELHVQQGVFDASWIEFFPLAIAFKDLIARDPDARAMYEARDAAQREGNNILWGMYGRELEFYGAYPAFLMLTHNMTNEKFKNLLCIKDPGEHDYLSEYRERVNALCKSFVLDLVDADMLNHKSPAYVVRNKNAITRSLLEGTAGPLFDIDVISGTPGRFAACRHDDGMYLSPGIADFKSKKGEPCDFTSQCCSNFFSKLLQENDIRAALAYVADRARMLATGEVLAGELRKDIKFSRILSRGHEQYSAACHSPHVVQARKQKGMSGDRLEYEYSIDAMQRRFFGLTFERPKDDDLFSEPIPNLTERGKVSEMMSWALPIRQDETTKQLMTRLFAGQATESTIDALAQIYVMTKGRPVKAA